MNNQVETQKEGSQGTSIQQSSMHYLPRGGSENNMFQNNLLQIQLCHVNYRFLWMRNQVEKLKERSQGT